MPGPTSRRSTRTSSADARQALACATGSASRLEFGALLHDVGKITVPKEIINKPGRVTPEEFEIVKTHTTEGQRMLDRVGGFMREVGVIVRHHHEQWDGGGYPDRLAGSTIPLEARIVACCDTLNAITTDRACRASPMGAALAELRRCSGSQFDPALVEAVVAVVGVAPEPHERSSPTVRLRTWPTCQADVGPALRTLSMSGESARSLEFVDERTLPACWPPSGMRRLRSNVDEDPDVVPDRRYGLTP